MVTVTFGTVSGQRSIDRSAVETLLKLSKALCCRIEGLPENDERDFGMISNRKCNEKMIVAFAMRL